MTAYVFCSEDIRPKAALRVSCYIHRAAAVNSGSRAYSIASDTTPHVPMAIDNKLQLQPALLIRVALSCDLHWTATLRELDLQQEDTWTLKANS